MTQERLAQLKIAITERANYYSNIGFINLANEFTNVGNFLAEIEDVIKNNEELKARIRILEEKVTPAQQEETDGKRND